MRYFSYISFEYTPKNSLHKAVYEFLKANDRKVIEEGKVEDFKKRIIKGIQDLNAAHTKHNPVDVHWWNASMHGSKDHILNIGLGTICTFNLYREDSAVPPKQEPIPTNGKYRTLKSIVSFKQFIKNLKVSGIDLNNHSHVIDGMIS